MRLTKSALSTLILTGLYGSALAAATAPRTGLYSEVVKGNAASDNTVDDLTKRPHLINQQYIAGWGNAQLTNAAYSFKGGNLNWFGTARSNPGEAEIRTGVGSTGAWGGGLIVSLHRTHTEDPIAGKTTTNFEGQGLGGFGSFNLGSVGDVYGQVAYYAGFDDLTIGNNNAIEVIPVAGPTVTTENHLLNFMAGWKKDASQAGEHALNVELNMNFSSNKAGAAKNGLTNINLSFYHGYILQASDDFSVFLGSNNSFIYNSASADPGPDASGYTIASTPNISFQKKLGWGFDTQAGAGVTIAYVTQEDNNAALTDGADMSLGLRWTKDNFAIEGLVREALLSNGPQFIGGGAPGLFASIGLSVGF